MKNHLGRTIAQRLLCRVSIDPASGCWNWTGSIGDKGYGRITIEGHRHGTHIVCYEMFVGPVPEGRDLHHMCENRRCMNPEHLMPVTPAEHNAMLSPRNFAYQKRRRTHCPKGHLLSADNLDPWQLKARGRACLTCARAHRNAYNKRNRERLNARARVRRAAGSKN